MPVVRGEKNVNSKYTEQQVQEIKNLLSQGMRGCEIARITGVNKYTISDIKRGKSWVHL